MILLEKKVKLRPENTINFTENIRVFKLESSTYTSTLLIRFSYRNFPPPEMLTSLNNGKSISIVTLGINLFILAEIHVFLNPGTKKPVLPFYSKFVKLYSSCGCPCELDGSHILGGGQQLGLKVMLCQGLLRPELFIEPKI